MLLGEAYFVFCFASIKKNNAAKDLGLNPISSNIRDSSWVLFRILILRVRECSERGCMRSPRFNILSFRYQYPFSPFMVSLVFICAAVNGISSGAGFMAGNNDKFY